MGTASDIIAHLCLRLSDEDITAALTLLNTADADAIERYLPTSDGEIQWVDFYEPTRKRARSSRKVAMFKRWHF